MSTPSVLYTFDDKGELVLNEGWQCPFPRCGSRMKGARSYFATERGVRQHMSRQHGIKWSVGMQIARLYQDQLK